MSYFLAVHGGWGNWEYISYILYSVDGGWSIWGSWGTCSVTCGNGTKARTRTCDNPPPANRGDDCPGPQQETSACLMNPCPGNKLS